MLVAAADPITLTGADVGRHAVLVNANDIAVMGVRPRWFLATVLLPPGTTEPAVRALFASMHAALAALGVTFGEDGRFQLVIDGRNLTNAAYRPGFNRAGVPVLPAEGIGVDVSFRARL